MADIAWQGQSGMLNEYKLGNDRKPPQVAPIHPLLFPY
jgi:hypothetical protein